MMSPHENWMPDDEIAAVIAPFFEAISTLPTVAAFTYAQLNSATILL